jgi:hypothetical protein
VGFLTQVLGSWHHLVAYLSKQVDAVSWGWLPCLCNLVATAILVAEADKLTLGQELTVWVPHSALTLMRYKENYWLTSSQMVKYQSMLCENLHIQLEVKTLNPATLLLVDSGPPKAWLFRGYGWGVLQPARLDWPCREWSMRSLWELEISTAMYNNLQAGIGTAPCCRTGQGQNAARLLFLRCLRPESSDYRFPYNYNVMPPENCCSTPLFATVHNKLAGGHGGCVCLHQSTQPTWSQIFCMFIFCPFSISCCSQLAS